MRHDARESEDAPQYGVRCRMAQRTAAPWNDTLCQTATLLCHGGTAGGLPVTPDLR